jgi:predicted transcriptional regulator
LARKAACNKYIYIRYKFQMTKKLSFKEYYESKESLLLANANLPKVVNEYVVKKYCKLPVLDENNKKDYISLKPKDLVQVLWEFNDIKNPQAKKIMVESSTYSPCWSNDKLKKWIEQTTLEKSK